MAFSLPIGGLASDPAGSKPLYQVGDLMVRANGQAFESGYKQGMVVQVAWSTKRGKYIYEIDAHDKWLAENTVLPKPTVVTVNQSVPSQTTADGGDKPRRAARATATPDDILCPQVHDTKSYNMDTVFDLIRNSCGESNK